MSAVRAAAERLDGWWRTPAPAERLAALRILTGLFAWIYTTARLVHFSNFDRFGAGPFDPIGVVGLLDAPLGPATPWVLTISTSALGLAFVLGWRFKITGPLFAALLLWVTTYRSAWAMVFHTENLMVVHVWILAWSASARAWSLDARR